MKSANEELQSSNEELQSTNEELQTSKEELQSINEELNTVNVELQSKMSEVSVINSDLNNLISSTEIGTIFLDDHLNIKRFTPSVTSILNLIPTDIGRPLHHISSNLQYENLSKDAENVLNTLIPKQFDVQTNEKKWFTTRLIPYRTLENVINGVVITFVDITERKRIEKELSISEEKYRNFVDKAYEGVWAIDSNAVTIFVNPQMAKLLDYSPNEMIDKSLYEFMAESEIKVAKENFEKRKKGISEEHDFEFLCKNGRKIYARLQTSPLFEEDGSFNGAIAYVTDITDRKKAEALLNESEKKYHDAYEKAEFYKDLFTHDISNILQNIGLPIEIILKHQVPEEPSKDTREIFETMKKIYEQFIRASQLVSNIRKLSKIDESINILRTVNFVEILNKAMDYVMRTYSEKVLTIKSDFKFNEIYVQADDFLRDVFENLLNNSIKHNESPTIEIQVKTNKILENNISYVKCEFLDNGEGIPDDFKLRIFKGPINSQKALGMGIGLTLVSKILSKYKGKISIEDRVSGDYTKGANFIVLIPEAL